ncbi:ribonuclease H-like domain-containing protein [Tanacetum coccineum]
MQRRSSHPKLGKMSLHGQRRDCARTQDFSKIARPLTKLLEKDIPFEFNDECRRAFESLKKKLTCAPVIVSPNWNLPFELMCDVSDFATGAVLEFDIEIKDRKGTENVVADHLSRIENDESSDDSEVDDNFPRETLMEINTKDEPCLVVLVVSLDLSRLATTLKARKIDSLGVTSGDKRKKSKNHLLMATHTEDHLAKFHKMTDAKEMWEAIKSRFCGNDESKKMQKYILKQQLKLSVSNSEVIAHGYDRLMSLVLEEMDLKWASGHDFMRLSSFTRENKEKACNQKEIKKAKEEMQGTLDIKQKTMGGDLENRRNLKLCIEIQAYTQALKKVEAQLVTHQKNQLWYEEKIRFMKIDLDDKTSVLTYHKKLLAEAVKEIEELKTKLENFQSSSKGLSKLLNSQMSKRDKYRHGYGDQVHDDVLSYENKVFQSVFDSRSSDVEDSPVHDRFENVEGMHAVPSPMTGNYMPLGPDMEVDDSIVEILESVPEPVVVEPKVVSQPKVWSDAPIIEEYESDSDDEYVIQPSKEQERPSFAFVNTVKHVKTPRKTVKEQNIHSPSPKADKKDWNGLMSKRLGLGYGFTKKAWENRPVWNNVQRLKHQNQFVPTAVLTRTGRIQVNTASHTFNSQAVSTSAARKVNAVRPIVNENRPRNNFHKSHSPIRRPFNRTIAPRTKFSNQKVNTAEVKAVSAIGEKRETAVKPSTALKNKGIVDSRCSRHMTRNKPYLAEYQDYNGGLVAFGGSKSYITGKGKIKTGKLDFKDVCFVKELQHFNLFSVS